MTDIDHRIAALESQLADLKAAVQRPAAAPAEQDAGSTHDRRTMFKKFTLGAAGVATVGTVGALAGATPAAAAPAAGDGGNITVGEANTGTANSEAGTRLAWNSSSTVPKVNGILFGTQVSSNALTVSDNRPGFFLGNPYASSYPAAVAGYNYSSLEAGVYGFSSSNAGVVGFGGRAAFHAAGGGTVANTLTTAHSQGDIIRTDDGDLWYCSVEGTPGTLRKLSGAATAGQLHLLPSPVRVYDSRPAVNGPAATGDGPLAGGTERTVGLATGFVGTTATPAVPAGATAALITLTVTGTTNGGFLSVFSNAITFPGTSNINWSASNQDIATTTVSAVDAAAKVKLHAGGSPTGTNVIIDVIAYYQ